MASRFSDIEVMPPMEMFKVRQGYINDTDPNKVDLGVGAYRTDEAEPWVLPVVRRTERMMADDMSLNHEYLMFLGMDSFCEVATELMLGKDSEAVLSKRAFGIQTPGGTGALRLGGEFLSRLMKYKTLYISNPTWVNHHRTFTLSGMLDVREYRYWDATNLVLDLDGLLQDLGRAPANAVVVLHVCAHNPTGCDPTRDQWVKIADVMEERKLFPFFDCAYQGFASGVLEQDAWAVRYFVERGFELFCAQSFSKNFGLYNERTGNLIVVPKDGCHIERIRPFMMHLARGMYLTPANHGARIVNTILRDPQLYAEWQESFRVMANRTLEMRKGLRERLEHLDTPGSWDHITTQIGMFSFTGLSPRQVEFMIQERHIYMMSSGRINMCGLTTKNIDHVAKAIHDAVVTIPKEEAPTEKPSNCIGF